MKIALLHTVLAVVVLGASDFDRENEDNRHSLKDLWAWKWPSLRSPKVRRRFFLIIPTYLRNFVYPKRKYKGFYKANNYKLKRCGSSAYKISQILSQKNYHKKEDYNLSLLGNSV